MILKELDVYLLSKGVEHFTAREITPVGKLANGKGPALQMPPQVLWKNIIPTLLVLESLRKDVGPLIVLSGWRDPAYNKAVKGEDGSLHTKFSAIDFYSTKYKPLELAKRLALHPQAGVMGIGCYPTAGFVHVDTRGLVGGFKPKARWGEDGLVWWL